MGDSNEGNSSRISRVINASREAIFRAFTDPSALEIWLVPGDMTGKVHEFDLRAGGGYQMSLYYPSSEPDNRGKTSDREDRFTARFVELTPPSKIVEAITFDTEDPAFSGEMTMTVTFEERDSGTEVTILFENIPLGIRPEDNDAGTRSSLAKLARYVEDGPGMR
jgi:uncharacterized protein YndB with AHSA1/START domain